MQAFLKQISPQVKSSIAVQIYNTLYSDLKFLYDWDKENLGNGPPTSTMTTRKQLIDDLNQTLSLCNRASSNDIDFEALDEAQGLSMRQLSIAGPVPHDPQLVRQLGKLITKYRSGK